jgi:hypothetical protein
MSRRSRRLTAALNLLAPLWSRPLPRDGAAVIVRRLLAVVLVLGGLSFCAGPASAAPLRWSGFQATDSVGNIALGSMACTSSSACVALDADGRLVQFGSDPNQLAPNDIADQDVRVPVDPPAPLVALACSGTAQCTAVDRAGSVTTFNVGSPYSGFRFTRVDQAVSETGGDGPTAIACASTSRCVLVDGAGGAVSFSPSDPSAAIRTVLDPGPGSGLLAVACPSATQCTAIGATREWTFDPSNPAAAMTTTIDTAPAAATALVCPSVMQCTAVDGSGRETTFDPQTTAAGTPVAVSSAPGADLTAVVCPTAALCTAADHAGYLESFDPRTGALVSRVPATDVDDLACLTGTYCLADQSTGSVLPFDAGSSQDLSAQATGLDGGSPILAVTCPTADRCISVDPSRMIRFDPHPGHDPLFGGIYAFPDSEHNPITGLDCPLLTLCTVVRGDEQITFDIYRFRHLRPRIIDHDAGAMLTAVRCPTAKECVAVDDDGHAITYDPANGHIVRGRISVQRGRTLTALACPGRTQCTATDDDGHAISFDPLTGQRLLDATIDAKVGLDTPADASGHELDAITCHNTRACAAVDTLGDVVTFNPRSHHGARLHRYDSAVGLTAISCPNGAMCMAAGDDGRVYYGRPGASRWRSTHLLQASALTAVTCESTTVCVASDESGQTYTSH